MAVRRSSRVSAGTLSATVQYWIQIQKEPPKSEALRRLLPVTVMRNGALVDVIAERPGWSLRKTAQFAVGESRAVAVRYPRYIARGGPNTSTHSGQMCHVA